jgi:tRNA(Ile)-lysidine synthase
MKFNADVLLQRLRELQGEAGVGRYLVGFSGGLDSTVLLHALVATRGEHATPIVAVHVNHALHPDAAAWERQCRRIARELAVEYVGREVAVVDDAGIGLEAAAREARYGALKAFMQDGDVLLSAHHEEDQAETLLLNLMRGSGLAGLAGIGGIQHFGSGLLIRPLLGVSRPAIERYARESGLVWIDDPANADLRFDRNYLRQEILPRLRQRWPAVSARVRQTSELASEASALLQELGRLDVAGIRGGEAGGRPDRLDIPPLQRLGAARQRNLLRYAIRACGLPQAPSSRLGQIQNELLTARIDAQPLVRWHGAEARRYREKLYLLPEANRQQRLPGAMPLLFADGRAVELGPGLGALRLERAFDGGVALDPQVVAHGLQIRFRQGGEKIRPTGRNVTRPVKKLLQEQGVLPWMRRNVPLLYAGETLVAVADLWMAADCAQERGISVRWIEKPSMFHAE